MASRNKTPIGNFFPFVTLSNTDAVILPAANKRRTITLCNPAAVTITVTLGTVAVQGQGINVPGNSNPFMLVRDATFGSGFEVGSLIDADLHGISSGASHVTLIVTYDP